MEQFALVGLVDVSMTMTVLTPDHYATKEDAHKELEGQMPTLVVPVDLLLQVALETLLDNPTFN
jgi:hypothetical protein